MEIENIILPKAYLVGDSIAAAYAPGVQRVLAGDVIVRLRPENGKDSRFVLANLDGWLGGERFDVIHFNCGLHDIKRKHGTDSVHVPIVEYEENLRCLVNRLRRRADVLIWARTTPVADGRARPGKSFDRFNCDVDAYNHVADRVMASCGVVVDDLHEAIERAGVTGCLSEDGVHMTEKGDQILSDRVAAAIRAALASCISLSK